jgi:hypothetical protein
MMGLTFSMINGYTCGLVYGLTVDSGPYYWDYLDHEFRIISAEMQEHCNARNIQLIIYMYRLVIAFNEQTEIIEFRLRFDL